MTTEEMEKRWPAIPPFEVTMIRVFNIDGHSTLMDVNQDNIENVIEYFQAAKESMNA